jgi:hypothetical protein
MHRPFDLIVNSLSRWLGGIPQLKIFGTIVEFVAIDVVDVFAGQQIPAKDRLHDIAMLTCSSAALADDAIPVTIHAPRPYGCLSLR